MEKQVLMRKHEQTRNKMPNTLGMSSFMVSPSSDVLRDLNALKPVYLKDVTNTLNVVHEGKVVFCRTVVLPAKSAGGAVVSLVEDKNGDLCKTSFYNYCDFYDELSSVMPPGSMLAIVNPFAKMVDDQVVLRVDNPSSVLRYHVPEDFYAAAKFSFKDHFGDGGVDGNTNKPKSLEEWKEQGNEQFNEKSFYEAIACYTNGLKLDPNNTTLLSNRSAAHLVLGHYDESYADAKKCLMIDPTHVKCSFRLVKSLFLLRRFAECTALANELEKGLLQGNTEVRDMNILSKRGKLESTEGKYDVNIMIKEQTMNATIEGHSDYVNPKITIEVGKPGSGGSVKCNSDIRSGELIMACKAFEVVGSDEIPDAQYVDVDTNRARTSVGQMLAGRLMRKITDKPERAKELYQLFANGFPDAANVKSVNLSRILAIEDSNSFVWNKDPLRLAEISQAKAGNGLWIKPAFLRHSCIPNCHRFFVGDYLFVCASFDVPKGQELTFSYVETPLYNEAHNTLQEVRGVNCHCPRCQYFESHLDLADKENQLYARYRAIGKKYLEAERVDLSRLDFTPVTDLLNDIRAVFPNDTIQHSKDVPYSIIEHDVLYLFSAMSDAKQDYEKSKPTYERMLKFADEDGLASLKSLYCRLNLAFITLEVEKDTEKAKRMRDECVKLWTSNYGGLFSETHFWKVFGMPKFLALKNL